MSLTFKVKESFFAAGWRLPFIEAITSFYPVILIYHGVPQDADEDSINAHTFEQHVSFLKSRFELVSPKRLGETRKPLNRIRVILTFDDGFRNHAEVAAPILRKHQIPAIFFVSSRHSSPGKYLWFSYLRALQDRFPAERLYFRGESFDMSPDHRRLSVDRLRELLLSLRPHPAAMYEAIEQELPPLDEFVHEWELRDRYAGMTVDQLAEVARDPLFSIGIHTIDHPFLTRCEPKETARQIHGNKIWIERISGQKCNSIAYPSGDYNLQTLTECKNVGILYGHAVIPVGVAFPNLEIPRIGVYSTSLELLGFKVQWGNFIRFLKLRAG